ncbi:MAG: hypothetical protein A2X08_10795 [Bacteroidetes bacterium GWA2_32_17]|nr:MAG: hypothetical protein A2X08_10795 [Bacteroidetes bacterium GWA2_32_17]
MATLFQKSVEKKYLNEISKDLLKEKFAKFQNHFAKPDIQQNIRGLKEEEYQEGFVRDLFVEVLGYTLNPQPNFNFVLEKKNVNDSKKADGAIHFNEKVIAVIELKGTDTTNLKSVEVQAFGYKNNQPDCKYIITSNFEKLRFYINNAVDHEEFNLFNLTIERFALLWLCLAKENILADLPLKIKNASVLKEENVTKELYKDYSSFKHDLFRNIVELNPGFDKLLLFKKSQKLLDRFLFIFFAEDKSLLPPNSISEIVKQWEELKDMDEYTALYNRFKKYFGYLNTGHKGKKYEIFAYNGGLFTPDEILDNIIIDDEILRKHIVQLSNYDFESEVDVNILGHIFEHSLNELDEIQSELEGKTIDKNKTKRKKDGVFYTPKYITKYIVENTVGKLCEEKKIELEISDSVYENAKKRSRKRIENIDKYRKWLLSLTICDPACGSGAFLNMALDFLISEHRYLDELTASYHNVPIVFTDVENHILEKNLFGVDLNDESVEIARLSLWLRTAQSGRKLTTLSNNIKCGNSLIDDSTVAEEKAFNWQNEFPEVFHKKEKKAFHITTATHDSRTSQRMIDYKVREKRDNGLSPNAQSVWLELEDEVLITKTVAEIIKEDKLNVISYNICGDHIHLLLVCEEEEVSKIVGKIKGKTSRAYHFNKGINPLVQSEGEKSISLWTQKFGCNEIKDETQLWNTIEYIRTNRQKHELSIGTDNVDKGKNTLTKIIESFCCDYEHAFRTEYAGGFDVVIGNPPYVFGGNVGISNDEKNYFKIKYETGNGKVNLFTLFIEKSYNILKDNGEFSFIIPNTFLRVTSYHDSRKYFIEKFNFRELADLGSDVFNGAVTTAIILVASKNKPDFKSKVRIIKDFSGEYTELAMSDIIKNDYLITSNSSSDKSAVIQKVISNSVSLGNECKEMIFGVVITKNKDEVVSEFHNEDYKPFLEGKDISSYYIKPIHQYLNYNPKLLHRARSKEVFEVAEKLLVQRITGGKTPLKVAYDNNGYYNKESINNIILKSNSDFKTKYILTILNSTLINWFYNNQFTNESTLTVNISKEYLSKIPIKLPKSQLPFVQKADQMLSLNNELHSKVEKVVRRLNSNIVTVATTNKISNFYEHDFKTFLSELKKQKIELNLKQQDEWEEYFDSYKKEILEIKKQINITYKEIDQMVYELYGLSEEKIKIVETT